MAPTRFSAVPSRLGIVALAMMLLAGCATTRADEVVAAGAEGAAPSVAESQLLLLPELSYGAIEGVPLMLDACLPPGAPTTPRPGILIIHGGSWTRGDKADEGYARLCRLFAVEGYAAFSLNYRLAPDATFPAAIDDLEAAVRWLREPEQAERFALDPERIAAFGGSAGGNLAALLGTRGSGDLTSGSRVAAVVDLSGPTDLTGAHTTVEFAPVQLAYLGCRDFAHCPSAAEASPLTHVDPTDPPFFIAHSTNELIPIAQSGALVGALRGAGVTAHYVRVEGDLHSIAMLTPELEQQILDFLGTALAPTGGGTA